MTNQPPPIGSWNLATSDPTLMALLAAQGAEWAVADVARFGGRMGQPDVQQWAVEANRFTPELRTHDRFGDRIDEVVYHPSYHRLMELAVAEGLHGAPWADSRAGAHVARAAKSYLSGQIESGHGCPIAMTYAVIPVLRTNPGLAEAWEPGLTTRSYDAAYRPAGEKSGLLAGMAMTERQGGSDVRANTTTAVPVGDGGEYRIDGHKWFCSAPMCDIFLILAQAPGGLSCFAAPRWRPDGSRNGFVLERLKDKLGNRSNASSEVRLVDAMGWLVGEEGRGVATIIEMVNHTRLDCVVWSTSLIRQAVTQAAHHIRHRAAFGKPLVEQPLMRNVVADLALDAEAAVVLMMRLAGAFDRAADDPYESAWRRVATPVAKFWVTKRTTPVVAEALECIGGNGYVEESVMPRLFRESPLNSIWEGSGNVMCLDVLRALRSPSSAESFVAELELAAGADQRLDDAIADTKAMLASDQIADEALARSIVSTMAVVLQASLLTRFAPSAVAAAYTATRVGRSTPAVMGAARLGSVADVLIDRVSP